MLLGLGGKYLRKWADFSDFFICCRQPRETPKYQFTAQSVDISSRNGISNSEFLLRARSASMSSHQLASHTHMCNTSFESTPKVTCKNWYGEYLCCSQHFLHAVMCLGLGGKYIKKWADFWL